MMELQHFQKRSMFFLRHPVYAICLKYVTILDSSFFFVVLDDTFCGILCIVASFKMSL